MLGGNPKKIAYDVALGFQQLTPGLLRQYGPEDLNAMLFNLQVVLREIRGKPIPPGHTDALVDRNMKIGRVNQAINVLQSYCRSPKRKL